MQRVYRCLAGAEALAYDLFESLGYNWDIIGLNHAQCALTLNI